MGTSGINRTRSERRVVTFYSFKGGIGRTMTLANVAWRLAARHGLRVIVVDWDLEGPGLHEFFGVRPEQTTEAKGILDFLAEWMASIERRVDDLPDLAPWLLPITDGPAAPPTGSIAVLLAGRLDAQYVARLNSFDWTDFYEDIASSVAFDALRAQLLELADVVLIDCRAGLSPSSRVCTQHLADGVMLMTPASDPSIASAERVARAIVREGLRADGRPSPRLWFVVSYVPVTEESGLAHAWFERWREWFTACEHDGLWRWHDHPRGIATHKIPYRARWSFGDALVLDDPNAFAKDPLAEAYDRLAATVYEWHVGDPWEQVGEAMEPTARVDTLRRQVRAAEERRDIPGVSASLLRLGMALGDLRRLDEAVAVVERAVGIEMARGNLEEAASRMLFVAQCLHRQRRHDRVAEVLDRVFQTPRTSLYAEWLTVEALASLYQLQRDRGEREAAERTREAAAKIELGDDRVGGRRRRLREIDEARIKIERTELASAWTLLDRELRTAVESGDTVHEARVLDAMAEIRYRQMRFEAALSLWRQAVALDRRTGRWGDHTLGLAHSARCERRLGRFDRAKELAENAIGIARECESPWCESVAVHELGAVHLARGQFEAASLLFHRAMVLAATGANRECEVLSMRSLARVRMHEGRQPEARSVLEYALRAAREVGLREIEAAILRDIADVHVLQENPVQAVTVLDECAALLRDLGSHIEEFAVLQAIVPLLHDEGFDSSRVDARSRDLRTRLANEGVDLAVASIGVYV